MSKIETDFEKLNHYQDIETYYPPLEDIKDFLYELFGDRVESQKYIIRANRKLEQLQSNWNSLKEELYQANRELVPNELVNGKELINNVLDKMNELESGDK